MKQTIISKRVRRLGKPLPTRLRRAIGRVLFSSADRRRDEARFRAYVRPTDVFLVGHPKSGNTWIAYMLAVVLEAGDAERRVNMANIGHFIPAIHGADSKIAGYDAKSDPRIFRNEWPIYSSLYPRTLYLVRDPRSVLVSYYHHYRVTTGDNSTSLDAFVGMYLRDGCIRSWEPQLIRWDRQVTDWIGRAHDQPLMAVKYEALHHDRRRMLRDITKFCGIRAPVDAIAMAVERGSFETMRLDEERSGAEAYPQELGQRGWFLRRGRVDGWKDELSLQSRRAIDSEFRPVMEAMGYTPSR